MRSASDTPTPQGTAGARFNHPAFSGPVRLLTLARPEPLEDESTTAQTIAVMCELARADSLEPAILRATRQATAGARDPKQSAQGIHRWIREHVRFSPDAQLAAPFDPNSDAAEVLVRPVDLLAMPAPHGDCDDFSMLAAAMLRAAGIPAAFRTVAADSADYSHVYVVAYLPCGPAPLDASHGPYLGWETEARGKARTWPIDEKKPMPRNLGDWSDVLESGIDGAAGILGTRYAVPQLNAGQYISTPQGVMYQAPAGYAGGIPSLATGGNSTLYVVGGLGLVLVLVMMGGRR